MSRGSLVGDYLIISCAGLSILLSTTVHFHRSPVACTASAEPVTPQKFWWAFALAVGLLDNAIELLRVLTTHLPARITQIEGYHLQSTIPAILLVHRESVYLHEQDTSFLRS